MSLSTSPFHLRFPLFPYTTLFRSNARYVSIRRQAPRLRGCIPHSHALCEAHGCGGYTLEAGEDRKSTRLNSSHANTSYAVFCLAKKNWPGPCPQGRADAKRRKKKT